MGKIKEALDKAQANEESLFDQLLDDKVKNKLLGKLDKLGGDFIDESTDFDYERVNRMSVAVKAISKALHTGKSAEALKKDVGSSRKNLKTFEQDIKIGLKKLDKILADYEAVLKQV